LNLASNNGTEWEAGLVDVEDLDWKDSDAMARSLEDNTMDGYKTALGIHNVTRIDCALKEAPCRYFVF
jgi:ubiquinone/menaquinone biosynthesis C-methylase UbiE